MSTRTEQIQQQQQEAERQEVQDKLNSIKDMLRSDDATQVQQGEDEIKKLIAGAYQTKNLPTKVVNTGYGEVTVIDHDAIEQQENEAAMELLRSRSESTQALIKGLQENQKYYLEDKMKLTPLQFMHLLTDFLDVSAGVAEYNAAIRLLMRVMRLSFGYDTRFYYGEYQITEKRMATMVHQLRQKGWIIVSESPIFISMVKDHLCVPFGAILNIDNDQNSMNVYVTGDEVYCQEVKAIVDRIFIKPNSRITMASLSGNRVTFNPVRLKLSEHKIYPEAYPNIVKAGVDIFNAADLFVNNFDLSDIMTMISPPGTGKTTLISWIIKKWLDTHAKGRLLLIADQSVYAQIHEVMRYLTNYDGDGPLLVVMEDAPSVVHRNNASAMSALLNMTDGYKTEFIDTKDNDDPKLLESLDAKTMNADDYDAHGDNVLDKKEEVKVVERQRVRMIITANILPTDINDALVRPGRCMAVFYLDYLNREEVKALINVVGDELSHLKNYPVDDMKNGQRVSLAEIMRYTTDLATEGKKANSIMLVGLDTRSVGNGNVILVEKGSNKTIDQILEERAKRDKEEQEKQKDGKKKSDNTEGFIFN